MNNYSCFIDEKGFFGGYLNLRNGNIWKQINIYGIYQLTYEDEKKIKPYKTKYTHIHFPIKDRKIPDDWNKFSKFILKLTTIINKLKEKEAIYIHCKGGHGRSGVVASLLCHIYKMEPKESIEQTTKFHNEREGIKIKMSQKKLVLR